MKRYPHSYGGMATTIGTFNTHEVEMYFDLVLWTTNGAPSKVADISMGDREILIYSTADPHFVEMVCINRDSKQVLIRRQQEADRINWLNERGWL